MESETDETTVQRVIPYLEAEFVVELPVPWGNDELAEAIRGLSDAEKAKAVDEATKHDDFSPLDWEAVDDDH